MEKLVRNTLANIRIAVETFSDSVANAMEFLLQQGHPDFIGYFLLQDVLEMFFGKIRACGGFNNNPNVYQFKGAYRKLLANIKISNSEYANCRLFESTLPSNLIFLRHLFGFV